MFGLFKSKTQEVEEVMEAIKEASVVKPVKPYEPEPKPPAYEIGLTEDNRTTFTLRNGYGSTTLTMNSNGVRQLIRMLEATLDVDNTQEETNDV